MNVVKKLTFLFFFLPILFVTASAGWRVDFFEVLDKEDNLLFRSPAALGHTFMTRYIHSVELTPVEDEYYVVSGKLWAWEERVRSSKAGMPSVRPEKGRYIQTPMWMIYQGGRMSWNEYYYRIGNDRLGLNQAVFQPFGLRNLYKIFPGKRLVVRVKRRPFLFTSTYFTDKLENAPTNVHPINTFKR